MMTSKFPAGEQIVIRDTLPPFGIFTEDYSLQRHSSFLMRPNPIN